MVSFRGNQVAIFAHEVTQGDFGLAFVTDEKRPLNPQSYNYGAGTSGFKAPEQMAYANSETAEPMDDWKLLDHTNVYGKVAMGSDGEGFF